MLGKSDLNCILHDEEDNDANKKGASNGKAKEKGLNRAKEAAIMGAQKIRNGASNSVKWVRNICWKKGSPK